MSEPRDRQQLLESAERAASHGDFSSADASLRELVRVQEAELGPLHPDLANTLNNLAIVAEKTARPDDAEAFYRRASAIASASLPPDHPMVVESRQNLESFCRERGLSLTPSDEARTPTPAASPSSLPAPRQRSSQPFVWAAIGAIVLITVAVLMWRPTAPPEAATATVTTAAPTGTPVAAVATTVAPAIEPLVTPAPIEQPPAPEVVPTPASAPRSGS